PTDARDHCQFNEAAFSTTGDVEDGLRDVCPACRLFGCTGWKGKFNFYLADGRGRMPVTLDRPGIPFQMRFALVKPLSDEEQWLLSRTLRLIGDYGSMGGRTTSKPPNQPDYGVVEVVENIPTSEIGREGVARWVEEVLSNSTDMQRRRSAQPPEIPRLDLFFFNDGHWLDLRAINRLLRSDPTGFLAGRVGVSKKIFSFQTGKRFWGYAADRAMLDRVLQQLNVMNVRGTKRGEEVLHEL
ncbi:MAG: hypothetical protein U9Q78_05420, partial [Chloroflexota bacterium]|nr:hypothetical protein [Chloroflexota bacterium]